MDDGRVVATYTATDLNKAVGKVLDDAAQGTVRIKRRGTSYVLMREETLDGLLAAVRGFLTDTPLGKERL